MAIALVAVVSAACSPTIKHRAPSQLDDAGGEFDSTALGEPTTDPDKLLGRDGAVQRPTAAATYVLPYRGARASHPVEIAVDLRLLDVHFSVDTTSSFADEIDTLQATLTRQIVPAVRSRVDNVGFGVSRFADFPRAPFGDETDRPYALLSQVTTQVAVAESRVNALDQPLGLGGDVPEAGAEALYQIATGAGYAVGERTLIAPFKPTGRTTGGVAFRDGAFRVVVHITDAPSHDPPDYLPYFPGTHTIEEAADALSNVSAHVVGISSGEIARKQLEFLAVRTNTFVEASGGSCPTGIAGRPNPLVGGRCPAVFDIASDGSGLSGTVTDAIVQLVNAVQYSEVYGIAVDDPLHFIEAIEAGRATSSNGGVPSSRDLHPAGDGVIDTFAEVERGDTLTFAVRLSNTTVPPADYEQVFHITLRILGDSLVLAEQTLQIVVPRGRLDGGA